MLPVSCLAAEVLRADQILEPRGWRCCRHLVQGPCAQETLPGLVGPAQTALAYLPKDGSLVCWCGEEASLFNSGNAGLCSNLSPPQPTAAQMLDAVQHCRSAVPAFLVDGRVSVLLGSNRDDSLTLGFWCSLLLCFHPFTMNPSKQALCCLLVVCGEVVRASVLYS